MRTVKLKQTIGSSFPADGADVRTLMTALAALGTYNSPLTAGNGGEITQWTDDALFRGLRNFQKGRGITPDGVAKPGGPTVVALNSALAEMTIAGAGGAAPIKGGIFTLDGGVGTGQTPVKGQRHAQAVKLKQTIGSSFPADGADVRTLMTALAALGTYNSPLTAGNGGEITQWTDDALFRGLRNFQKGRGITPDGVAKPGGPTVVALNSALAEMTIAGAGGAAPIKGGIFTLDGGVGTGQTNAGTDVQDTKRALAWAGYYPKNSAADATPDDALREGIRAFQQDFNLKRDGQLHPGGKTPPPSTNSSRPWSKWPRTGRPNPNPPPPRPASPSPARPRRRRCRPYRNTTFPTGPDHALLSKFGTPGTAPSTTPEYRHSKKQSTASFSPPRAATNKTRVGPLSLASRRIS